MTERTTPTVTLQPETLAALAAVPLYRDAEPAVQELLREDCHHATVEDGLELAEYLEALEEWGGDVRSYLAESGYELPAEQPVQAPEPEFNEAAVQAVAPQAVPVAAPAATPGPSEAEQAAARQESGKLLQTVIREYVRGERGLAKHRLEAGKLAAEYLWHWVSVRKYDRAAGVKTIAGRLMEACGDDVDVNALVAVSQAVRLLGEGLELGKVSYTALETLRPLVHRPDGTEAWMIVAGVETEAKALVTELAKSVPAMPVRTLAGRVKELDAKSKAVIAAELAAKAADPKAGKAAKDAAVRAQQQADKAAEQVAKAAEPKAGKDKPAAQPATATAAPAPANKFDGVDVAPRSITTPNPSREESSPLGNLLQAAKQGTAKDVAAMAAELVTGCEEPDDVTAELLRLLVASGELSKGTVRALQAALVLLARKEEPAKPATPAVSPVAVAAALTTKPSTNGTPAAAVA